MAIKPVHNEPLLLKQVSLGDPEAFAQLFRAYHQPLAEYVHRLTESQEMTEDIVQDVFIKLWMKRETLPELNNFVHYLFILSRNRTFNCLREKANKQVRQMRWASQFEKVTTQDAPPPEEDYRALIDVAVAQLPPQQQKVYFLSRYQHLKHKEIAAQLGISIETAKKHMKLALRSITQYVRAHINALLLLLIWILFHR
ncbi:RNA polymerase subunit sigma-24 [Chitinophaga alhagiae]|uniref:RNA polymerase subunit sigma-24 n=1 Tax=Chitinophaga alhagiae TaxID=2203219 RepID=A0ABM6WDS9_9BACT|nr:RNA polymerase sigma-70 factor [Chitinophaga alhagiae]AWO01983.1 RNA polymerase subunit sigma-24 [Chitinophaga alhagiae]